MPEFQRIECTRPWQDLTRDIHSEMGPTVWLTDLVSFHRKTKTVLAPRCKYRPP
jgi:hypothetical protein